MSKSNVPEQLTQLSEQIARLHETFALGTQKTDFLVTEFLADRTERKERYDEHGRRITRLEHWRTATVAGGSVAFAILWAKIRKVLGIE